jgi:DNA topoisomerase-3
MGCGKGGARTRTAAQPPNRQTAQPPGERIMKLAEELYQAGFLSYPRTETDCFSEDIDLRASSGSR